MSSQGTPSDFVDERVESSRPLGVPAAGRAVRVISRALTLRCPNCGRGPVMRHWFRMRERCGHCGLRIERGEEDYFIGSMMFNLVLAEGVFVVLFIGTLFVTWPDVPWDTVEWVAPLLALLAPLLFFPFSKLVWLGFDIMLRPVTEDELDEG
ncbi:MAG TPA: DUF983 domain-containing protein [Gemmatimonadaceae bacterium]|nr:DUF983 domain-containing protein [Gemmatimonadaceae bacterium]